MYATGTLNQLLQLRHPFCRLSEMFRISEDARAELLRLKSDSSRALLYQRVRERVRDVVDNVDDRRLRQRRYRQPSLFGFTVTVAADTYLVLWRVGADQTIEIHYIGPDI